VDEDLRAEHEQLLRDMAPLEREHAALESRTVDLDEHRRHAVGFATESDQAQGAELWSWEFHGF